YVRKLELVVIDAMKQFGVVAQKDPDAIGVWTPDEDGHLAKICALGVRIRRGVSLHGIALNVETDLSHFDLIVPCGLKDRRAISMRYLLGSATPSIDAVKQALAHHLVTGFDACTPRTSGENVARA